MFTFPTIKLSKVSWKFLNLKQFKICEVGTRVEYKSWHYTNFTCNHETLKLLSKIAPVNMIRKVLWQKLITDVVVSTIAFSRVTFVCLQLLTEVCITLICYLSQPIRSLVFWFHQSSFVTFWILLFASVSANARCFTEQRQQIKEKVSSPQNLKSLDLGLARSSRKHTRWPE